MKTIDELIEWMEKNPLAVHKAIYIKARELSDAEQKPPYDREAFRRELIVGLCGSNAIGGQLGICAEWVYRQADAIITEYERGANEK